MILVTQSSIQLYNVTWYSIKIAKRALWLAERIRVPVIQLHWISFKTKVETKDKLIGKKAVKLEVKLAGKQAGKLVGSIGPAAGKLVG